MVAFEESCRHERPDCVLVVGDLNSTLACSIVAKKPRVPIGHTLSMLCVLKGMPDSGMVRSSIQRNCRRGFGLAVT